MSRVFAACVAICLAASPVLAASPKIESAIKTFKAVAADTNKLKTFCAMTKVMDAAGEKEDPKLDAQIEKQRFQFFFLRKSRVIARERDFHWRNLN